MANRPYVVKQGDHLRRLAFQNGFDADACWADPDNAALKKLRVTYNLLLPGDVVQIPDGTPKWTSLNTGATNTFTANGAKTCTIKHTFVVGGGPLANAKYRLVGSTDDDTPKTTDGDGTATFDVPVSAEAVQVIFERGGTYLLNVGHLDPLATPSGLEQRLAQLGYLDSTGDVDPEDEGAWADHAAIVAAAVSAFQGDNDLPVSGTPDDATTQKLAQMYGC
jgi:Putative peptidoglycan binding domain